MDNLYTSPAFGKQIIQREPEIETDLTENTNTYITFFIDSEEKIGILPCDVNKNSLYIRSENSVKYSVVQKTNLNGETKIEYLEKNEWEKKIDLMIDFKNEEKEIILILYRRQDTDSNSRILQSDVISLEIEYKVPETTTPNENNNGGESPGESGNSSENTGSGSGETDTSKNETDPENTQIPNGTNHENEGTKMMLLIRS
jgi:hypothetical protein